MLSNFVVKEIDKTKCSECGTGYVVRLEILDTHENKVMHFNSGKDFQCPNGHDAEFFKKKFMESQSSVV